MLQVPSNLILLRLGAPTWLGVTIVAWGVVAALFAGLRNTAEFYILRFLLGITECGAFPGEQCDQLGLLMVAYQIASAATKAPGSTAPAGRQPNLYKIAGIWYHMNQFYSDRDLSVSYTWVSTASVLAQVLLPDGLYKPRNTVCLCHTRRCARQSCPTLAGTSTDRRLTASSFTKHRAMRAGGRGPDRGGAAVAERCAGPARLEVAVPAGGPAHHRLWLRPEGALTLSLQSSHCEPRFSAVFVSASTGVSTALMPQQS